MFDKDPMKFYDNILNQEMMMVKARIKKDEVKIEEKMSKRHIGARVEAVKEAIEKANIQLAQNNSPKFSHQQNEKIKVFAESFSKLLDRHADKQ